jgi:uncharacterized protein (UPF0261 family)
MPTIAILGTLDSKGPEHEFLADQIRAAGYHTLLINAGSLLAPGLQPDISAEVVAAAAGGDWQAVLARQDRGECVVLMARGATAIVADLVEAGRVQGIISLGGGGGTAICTAAMRALPIGFPKVMVSTLASGNTAPYVGTKDIVMIPAIADVAGINRLTRVIFENAAGAICGMVAAAERRRAQPLSDKPLIVASMFGNTTACVTEAKQRLEAAGYEVLIFAATGNGGRAMESLVESGLVSGVLDITTTEWADELLGGVLSAGPDRLEGAAKAAVPAIVTPGCLDMVNFGEPQTVPDKYEGRTFYHHNPQVTLMRTSAEECSTLGKMIAEKINAYTAPVTVLLPTKAISVISAEGKPFHDAQADQALFTALKAHLRSGIPVIEMDVEINDPRFSQACAEALLENIKKAEWRG